MECSLLESASPADQITSTCDLCGTEFKRHDTRCICDDIRELRSKAEAQGIRVEYLSNLLFIV
jgi:hypothetical protein